MRRRYAVVLVHARRFKPTVMLNATGQLKRVNLHFIRRKDGVNAGFAPGHKHQVQTKNTQRLQALDYHKMTLATVGLICKLEVTLVSLWSGYYGMCGSVRSRSPERIYVTRKRRFKSGHIPPYSP